MAETGARSRWNGLTLAALIAGPVLMALAIVGQVMLAPPWQAYTVLCYFLLGGLGLPVMIFGLMTKRIRGWWWLGVVLVLGVVWFVVLAILGPQVVELENCRADPSAAGGGQRYVCDYRTYQRSVIEYVLEGPEGWPFVRVTEVRY